MASRAVPVATTRRGLLAFAGAAGAAAVLGACGKDETPATAPTPAAPTPTLTPDVTPSPTQNAITTPVAGYADPTRWAGRNLVIAGWGGDYQDAQETAFFDPFAASTGASIQIKIADPARLREQVDQDAVSWDVLTFPVEDVLALARQQYLEPIDYAVVDKTPLFPEIALQYGVGASFFSTVIVYPAGTSAAPQGWPDFWDVPPIVEGEEPDPLTLRSLHRSPIGTMEFALLADGVEIPDLYPLDIERAFRSLDRIKQHVAIWYDDGKQPVELVVAGQVGMASAWNVRPWQLGVGDEVRFQWYGGMLSADAWVVPRGAPNKDVAMDFINFATRAVPSANFGRIVPFGPVNTDSLKLLRPDRQQVLPTSAVNRSVQFVQNWNWWADNLEPIQQRFEDWLLADTPPASPAP